MRNILILAWGLLPNFAVVVWEIARQRRSRGGELRPVSPEGIRWVQYAGGAYLLGYAGLALAQIDPDDTTLSPTALVLVVFVTVFSAGLLLWHLGQRFGSETPRLADLREQCYRLRLAIWRRGRALAKCSYRRRGFDRWALRGDLASAQLLQEKCDLQLRRLQHALSTEAFLRRVRFPQHGREEIATLLAEQRWLVDHAREFLAATEVSAGPAELAVQLVHG